MSGTLNAILNNMYQNYAVIFPAANIMDIQRTSISLVKQGFVQIPNDYIQFLSTTDGLNWNGVEFFSIHEHERKDCVFPNLLLNAYQTTQNLKALFPKSLILGMAPEQLILYEAPQKEYTIINRYTFNRVVQLPRFVDVLYFYWDSFSNVS